MLTVPLELMSLPFHLNVAHDPWTICPGVLSHQFGVPVELLRDPSNHLLLVPQSALNFCVSGRFRWGTKGFHTEIELPILTLAVPGGSRQQTLHTPSPASLLRFYRATICQYSTLRIPSPPSTSPMSHLWNLPFSTSGIPRHMRVLLIPSVSTPSQTARRSSTCTIPRQHSKKVHQTSALTCPLEVCHTSGILRGLSQRGKRPKSWRRPNYRLTLWRGLTVCLLLYFLAIGRQSSRSFRKKYGSHISDDRVPAQSMFESFTEKLADGTFKAEPQSHVVSLLEEEQQDLKRPEPARRYNLQLDSRRSRPSGGISVQSLLTRVLRNGSDQGSSFTAEGRSTRASWTST